MQVKIAVKNLNKSFLNVKILTDINLQVFDHDSLVIVGGSGSGKSVLIKCILGLLLPEENTSITINNIECAQTRIFDRPQELRNSIGMLFQSNALFDSLTIGENIAIGMYYKIARYGYITTQQRLELYKVAKEQLEIVGLSTDNLSKYPYELSGGMQKRVAIARLLTTKPDIIFLDEPTSGLDPVTAQNISSLMVDIRKRLNATMITISHDPICISEVANRMILIDNHMITWSGTLNDISTINNPYIEAFKRYVQH